MTTGALPKPRLIASGLENSDDAVRISLDHNALDEKRLRVQEASRGRSDSLKAEGHWNEFLEDSGRPRSAYVQLFNRFATAPRSELRRIDEQLEATMREMGVTFDIVRDRPWGRRPWFCDLMPQVFTAAEWRKLAAGVCQRMHAYECFLRDIYGERRILRQGMVPVHPVLGSPYYQRAARGLPRPGGAFLHLSGIAVGRRADGNMVVKHHYFSHASGISYMIQNRRAMARVLPQAFQDYSIHSIGDTPTSVLELLRSYAHDIEPTVVILSSGQGSAAYSEHSFLSRRMGIPLVQGGDLLVLNDRVYLKTVSGLERVEVIYSRLADDWIDPLVFRRDSLLGVPGLVQCIRKGTVAVINAVGSQLVDDRALLPFAPSLIRYYLGEVPILEDLETLWLGDLDQREVVFGDIDRYVIRPLYGERILTPDEGISLDESKSRNLIKRIRENPAGYVAQPRGSTAVSMCYEGGRAQRRHQDHILFAVRRGEGEYFALPGALTRVSEQGSYFTASALGGGSRDTWVETEESDVPTISSRVLRDVHPPSQHVTSRVAEAFYWVGRYLERARSLAGMIEVIEVLETEELNTTERMLYRPVWNRMLPPLEEKKKSRQSISNVTERFRLTFDLEESGSVGRTVQRATSNGESVLECLSLEAWSVLSRLRSLFEQPKRKRRLTENQQTSLTLKTCAETVSLVAQFSGITQDTMVVDGGLRFLEIGEAVERASISANAVHSMMRSLIRTPGPEREHAREIQLSAFLRLLNCRDVYRRVYQMRIDSGAVLELFWKNPRVPRSVSRCLAQCDSMLSDSSSEMSPGLQRTLGAIQNLRDRLKQIDWEELAEREIEEDGSVDHAMLIAHSEEMLDHTLFIHELISDSFLNHQIHMRSEAQPLLTGFTSHAV